VIAFAQNQRDEVRTMSVVGALAAEPGVKQQTYLQADFGVRRLTPKECLRLQGFPDDWFDGVGLSDSQKYRLCGNAVAVPCAEWIGRRIIECAG
jgi:DNA (cytosine-5)-methyltransferase 1